MVAQDQSKLVTRGEFEAFLEQLEDSERLFELINGEIIEKMPKNLHALITHLLNGFLFVYFRENPIAWVLNEGRISLPDDDLNDRIPDISIVLKQGRTFDPDTPQTQMPDLAIEVQSPGQSDKLMLDTANYYLSNGCRMVWIFYPSKRLVEVLTPDDRKLLSDSETLDGGDILPGFTLPLKEIFEQE
jgi:Uma2 family endonuclease